MRRAIALLLLVVCVGFKVAFGQGVLGQDFTKNLLANINQLTAGIQNNVQQTVHQIQENVQAHLAQIDRVNKDMAAKLGKDGQYTTTLGNGSTILINGVGGVSRTIFSGQTSNGEPYFRDSEDRVVGNILHHTDRIYNPTTRSMDEFRYTLDLKDPKAKPVPA
ncbi:uncharacterized protein [Venturia canescens]|uniref:uncharacterized protein n=1 Tax=Venturia canescens TaxID=32260 RepID=UPI001C9D3B71|nr:uncharacterized protein LOC122414672 [Venturia canescens]